ncbi:MAG TPA: hypothetical protein VIG99_13620 [Myxococcaceae bacterium]|jgi:hypothetical protein
MGLRAAGALAAALAFTLALSASCVKRRDVSGSGDERLDESSKGDALPGQGQGEACGPDGGTLLLLDAVTAAPLSCTLVTVSQDATDCRPADGTCASQELFRGRTGVQGRAQVQVAWGAARVSAVAAGYRPSYRDPAPLQAGEGAEIEMVPSEGFTLKFLDPEGNYLTDLQVGFKQRGEAIAQMTTNELANLHFPHRSPFAGEPVIVEAPGYAPLTVNGPQDLGSDGHTVTLHK